ncbi:MULTISPECIES: hypothetical protein [Mesorhizobium]|uniref:maleate cis-trans isomerase family protein n=1 Tax=Mesorhizobium TaxID=68287 RepID=UPI0033366BC6
MAPRARKKTKMIGTIVPIARNKKIPFEIIDDRFISNWLAEQKLAGVDYISFHTPDEHEAATGGFDYCERLANEDVLSAAAFEARKKGCDSVVWACTSASFFRGVQYARRQIQLLSESAAAPATNTSMAFLAALDALRAKRVDVVLPYSPEIAKMMVSFLSEVDIGVGRVWHMEAPTSGGFFEIDCEAELAKFVSSRPFSTDPILIPCTAISSLKRVEAFEKISGRPVITANQVTVWHALVLAGLTPSILDAGSFLRSCAQTGNGAFRSPLEN